jgi:4-amino-4-deoxy-L-arabinose transferase-like glycosyltransferase
MSEPLFIFLSLLSFWMFDLYFERHHHWLWMIACGTFVGMAYLTRYAGLALIATFAAALLILHTNWKKRLTSIGILLASAAPWILGWSIRNRLIAGNATNRAFAWHPLTSENVDPGLRVFSDFLIPIEPWRRAIVKQPGIIEVIIALILSGMLVWVLLTAWRYLKKPQYERTGKEAREVLSFTTGLFIFAYLASIVASMLMFDGATKFKLRILSPVLVSLLILVVVFGIWLRNRRRDVAIALTIAILALSLYKQSITVASWAKSELGYASFQWYDSKAMDYLSELPDNMMIYTNEPGAVYLYTGRGCYVLPDRFDSVTAIAHDNFEKGVGLMQADINQGKAVLALFDNGENVSRDVPALTANLYLAHKSAGDSIYAAQP